MSDSGRVWTLYEVDQVFDLSRRGWDNPRIGQHIDRFPGEIDRARWALLGRAVAGALLVLNGGRQLTVDLSQPPGWMRKFFTQTLGV